MRKDNPGSVSLEKAESLPNWWILNFLADYENILFKSLQVLI